MKQKWFIYVALGTDIAIASTKFIVTGITHSSAMLSEGIHSVIDAISQLLLIWGVYISQKKPDDKRPFGYGKEQYFWSFIVSLILFIMGGCISFYEGVVRLKSPDTSDGITWSYIVLAVAFVFTTVSAAASLKEFNKRRKVESFWEAVKISKDPSTFIILLGDIGDLAGLIIAFAGTYLGHKFGKPYYDGIASMLIGIVLIVISILLVKESRSLLMGETIGKKTMKQIIALAEADASVLKIRKQLSMYMGPEEILLQLNAVFKQGLTTEQITDAISNISSVIQKQYPLIKQIFIEPVK
jgi:cation diffusion facilitator family transporter